MVTVHVTAGGRLVTVRSGLSAEDLAQLRMRGGAQAGPPPAIPAPARAALPAGTVTEVSRTVDASGNAGLAGHMVKIGSELACSKVTLRLGGHLVRVVSGVLARTLPSPSPPATAPGCAARGSPARRCPRRPLVRSASSA